VGIAVEEKPLRQAQIISKVQTIHENSGGLFNADLLNEELPEARLHVWSAHIEGSWTTQLKNTGTLPLLRTQLVNYEATMQDFDATFAKFTKGIGLVRRGSSFKLQNQWNITGILGTLWAIMNIFFTGSVTAQEQVQVQAIGFGKTISQRVRVPVGSVSIHWDAD